jgi:hypothetical protein
MKASLVTGKKDWSLDLRQTERRGTDMPTAESKGTGERSGAIRARSQKEEQ